ncbi:MAG TPA: hypothetical protein VLT84_10710 [Acidobacteriota bacterium]|nr:hypothetical protein [Acidobacteriota bacterium]
MIFFPDNIVGSDFNFYGPRLSRLSQYIASKNEGLEIEFEPLLRADIAEQLADLRDVRVLRLRGRASLAASVRRASQSLSEAFEAATQAGDAEDIEVVLRMRPHSRRALGAQVLRAVRRMAGMDDLRAEARTFVVSGYSGRSGQVDEIDVLRDQLIVSKQIVRMNERSRALDADSAFDSIAEAHGELRDDLRAALAVTRG